MVLQILNYYPNGTMFPKSADPSNQVKNLKLLCESSESVVLKVGQENAERILTDNEANYVSRQKDILLWEDRILAKPTVQESISIHNL